MASIRFITLIIISFLIFNWGINEFPLAGVDEPRYTEASLNMIQNNDWVIPMSNGEPRYQKPALFYWQQALSFICFGFDEFASRLPSVIAATATVAFVYFYASLINVGFLAGLILTGSAAFFIFSKLAITDMSLCLYISATTILLFKSYFAKYESSQTFSRSNTSGNKYLYLAGIFAGLGLLCKGPIAFLLPALILFIFLVYRQDFVNYTKEKLRAILISLVIMLFIALPWYLAIHISSNGEFTQSFFLEDNFSRFTSIKTNHSGPFWYYIPVIFLGLFPWSSFILPAITNAFNKGKKQDISMKNFHIFTEFNTIWIITTLIFFTISQTKLVTYILPIFPPLAVLIANWWYLVLQKENKKQSKVFKLILSLLFILISLSIGAYVALSIYQTELVITFDNKVTNYLITILIISIPLLLILISAAKTMPKFVFSSIFIIFTLIYISSINFIITPLFLKWDSGIKSFCQSDDSKQIENIISLNYKRLAIPLYCSKQKVTFISEVTEISKIQLNSHSLLIIKKRELAELDKLSIIPSKIETHGNLKYIFFPTNNGT